MKLTQRYGSIRQAKEFIVNDEGIWLTDNKRSTNFQSSLVCSFMTKPSPKHKENNKMKGDNYWRRRQDTRRMQRLVSCVGVILLLSSQLTSSTVSAFIPISPNVQTNNYHRRQQLPYSKLAGSSLKLQRQRSLWGWNSKPRVPSQNRQGVEMHLFREIFSRGRNKRNDKKDVDDDNVDDSLDSKTEK